MPGTPAPRPARTITLTAEQLQAQWDAVFAAHPWLDGLTARGGCDDVFCCPDDPQDWVALSTVGGLAFLAGVDQVTCLSRGLVSGGAAVEPTGVGKEPAR